MREGFRQSMAWLHTWSGLLVGWVLFAVFATGTSAYYRDEISLWMRPELHGAVAPGVPQAQAAEHAIARLEQRAAGATRWFITLPDERASAVRASWSVPRQPGATGRPPARNALIDPATGDVLGTPRDTRGGDFLYRFHYDLHHMPVAWARWIVGFCAMFMLVAIISGVITHRRIFKDFFTFRPKKGQRSWLDAHNATAVLALPYHAMITYTGLVTLMFMYMPWGPQLAYRADGGEDAFFAEAFPSRNDAKPSGVAAPMVAVGPLIERAKAHWALTGNAGPVARITVYNPGDATSTVVLLRQREDRLSTLQPALTFQASTGALIATTGDTPRPAAETRGVMFGLHMATFANPLLRALFFLCGLAGCAMVATGALLWAVKERQKFAKVLKQGGCIGLGLRLVDGLNIAAIAGLAVAIAAYFYGNRLLPVEMDARQAAEIRWFFTAWGAAAVAALVRPTRGMWLLQLCVGALMFMGVPVLNAVTTDTHLGVTLLHGPAPVAAFDLVTFALGALLGTAAWMLHRRKAEKAAPIAKAKKAPAAASATVAPSLGETPAQEGA